MIAFALMNLYVTYPIVRGSSTRPAFPVRRHALIARRWANSLPAWVPAPVAQHSPRPVPARMETLRSDSHLTTTTERAPSRSAV